MHTKVVVAVVALGGVVSGGVFAQQNNKLAYLVPDVYNSPQGLTLPNPFHEAHFESSFQSNFAPLNTALASQITQLPIASPASGLIYSFGAAGVPTATAQSLGPVVTERAETMGRGRGYVAASYQYFSFTTLDGLDLSKLPVVFTHQEGTGPGGTHPLYEEDYIKTTNSIDLKINQFTVFGTIGVTNNLDVSVAVPILNVHLGVVSDAQIVRLAPPDPVFGQSHYFDPADPNGSTRKIFASGNTASGIGDVTFRAKWRFYRGERLSLALAGDVRTPTGDKYNFLGSGAAGFKPFIVASYRTGRISPHVNLGYQFNGKTVLAGNVNTGEKQRLPNQFFYALGADIGARKVTFAFDLLGQRLFDAPQALRTSYTDANGASSQQTGWALTSYNLLNGSVGVKFRMAQKVLVTANLIFKLNEAGLRAPVVPMVGLSFTL